ncbi:DMT family transporter [Rhodovibrionaceae bacterium A322]
MGSRGGQALSEEKVNKNHTPLQGISWMLVSTFFFVGVTVVVHHIGSDMPTIQGAFLRYFFAVVFTLPILFRLFKQARPSNLALKLYGLRGVLHGIAVLFWFYAMARIPIAEVTAIGYIAPIFVAIGAAVFLGEKMQIRRIASILVGFLGMLIIIRPGFTEVSLGQLSQLCAAPLFAASFLIAKKLTEEEDSGAIVAFLSLTCMLVLLPGAIYQWRAPTYEELGWLALTALFATLGHYTLTRAYQAAPITVTQPFSFLQLVWAALMGLLLFGEEVDKFVILGGAIIVASVSYISHREAVVARQQITPAAAATRD